MTDLKAWLRRNALWPLSAALAVVVLLQVAYLAFWARTEYLSQVRQIDHLVEAATLGIEQDNRPLIETALLAAVNEADVRQAAVCRGGEPLLAYPMGANPCGARSPRLLVWTLIKPAAGVAGTTFVFVIEGLRTFRTAAILLLITLGLALAAAWVLMAARRRFDAEVVRPLRAGVNGDHPLGIRELEDLRLRVREFHELKSREAISEALFEVSTQVAHDIRSPLSVLEALTERMAAVSAEDRSIAAAAVGRVREIAETLLSRYAASCKGAPIRRLEPFASKPPPTSVLLSPLIESIVEEKRVEFADRPGLTLDWLADRPSSQCVAVVEPVEFKRLISNLINNAIEALSDGCGRVGVKLHRQGAAAVVSVSDDGCGFPTEAIGRLGQRGASRKLGGFGLGLAHGKACADAWRGRLDIRSGAAGGTTVALTLPIEPGSVPQRLDAVLVDDDELVRRLWIGSARAHGKTIRTFGNASELLADAAVIHRRTPVYLDHDLGDGQRGEEVAKALRTLGFETIYLATGQSADAFRPMPWITGVVGKRAPWPVAA